MDGHILCNNSKRFAKNSFNLLNMKKSENVETYIDQFDGIVKERLEIIRSIIKENAPEAEEMISYGMPGYKVKKKPLVYFAGYKNHVGFYATPTGHEAFKEELSGYKQGKGSVQFPHDEEFPKDLIARIVRFRVEENMNK